MLKNLVQAITQGLKRNKNTIQEAINELTNCYLTHGLPTTVWTVNQVINGLQSQLEGVLSNPRAMNNPRINLMIQCLRTDELNEMIDHYTNGLKTSVPANPGYTNHLLKEYVAKKIIKRNWY